MTNDVSVNYRQHPESLIEHPLGEREARKCITLLSDCCREKVGSLAEERPLKPEEFAWNFQQCASALGTAESFCTPSDWKQTVLNVQETRRRHPDEDIGQQFRGAIGELILHVLLREHLATLPHAVRREMTLVGAGRRERLPLTGCKGGGRYTLNMGNTFNTSLSDTVEWREVAEFDSTIIADGDGAKLFFFDACLSAEQVRNKLQIDDRRFLDIRQNLKQDGIDAFKFHVIFTPADKTYVSQTSGGIFVFPLPRQLEAVNMAASALHRYRGYFPRMKR